MEACCLQQDLAELPYGDMTEVFVMSSFYITHPMSALFVLQNSILMTFDLV